jgi:hypothetical protein
MTIVVLLMSLTRAGMRGDEIAGADGRHGKSIRDQSFIG